MKTILRLLKNDKSILLHAATYSDAFIELAHSVCPCLLNEIDHLHQFFGRRHLPQCSLGNYFKVLADTACNNYTITDRNINLVHSPLHAHL